MSAKNISINQQPARPPTPDWDTKTPLLTEEKPEASSLTAAQVITHSAEMGVHVVTKTACLAILSASIIVASAMIVGGGILYGIYGPTSKEVGIMLPGATAGISMLAIGGVWNMINGLCCYHQFCRRPQDRHSQVPLHHQV